MVSSKPIICAVTALVASAFALSPRATSEFSLYAYGDGIGGLKLFYAYGGLYIEQKPDTASNITFTAPATNIVNTASLIVSMATADIVGQYFSVSTESNNAVTIAADDSSYTTTGFLFFNGVLVLKSSSGTLKSGFYAKPFTDDSYQIYWYNDVSAASSSDIALALKTKAPAVGAIAAETD